MLDLVIIILIFSSLNLSNTFAVLIPSVIEISASLTNRTNNLISSKHKFVLLPNSSTKNALSRISIPSWDVILSLIVLWIISELHTISILSSSNELNKLSVSGITILSFSSAVIPNSTTLFNKRANSQSCHSISFTGYHLASWISILPSTNK